MYEARILTTRRRQCRRRRECDSCDRTYSHCLALILLFTAVEVAVFKSGLVNDIMGMSRRGATRRATHVRRLRPGGVMATYCSYRTQHGRQYLSLIGFVLLEALFFVPILYVANSMVAT